jgi:hypothetical protein
VQLKGYISSPAEQSTNDSLKVYSQSVGKDAMRAAKKNPMSRARPIKLSDNALIRQAVDDQRRDGRMLV